MARNARHAPVLLSGFLQDNLRAHDFPTVNQYDNSKTKWPKLEAVKILTIGNCTCFRRRFYTTRRAKEENQNFTMLKGSLREGKDRK
jgi:hypothetical protein